jgi:cytochrome c biogenesis protein CcdA/thiol-disulfide isomerase/thioredoxin
MTLYFFAFLSGLVTIFAPCIWPLLPIILSTSITGGRRKPLGIVSGIAVSFLFATLLLALLLRVLPIDPEIFRIGGIIIILLLGITLVVPRATAWLEGKVSRLSRFFGAVPNAGNSFWSGFITGAALGLVWSPCAGPILATVATVAATQGVDFEIFFIAVSFVVGVAVPLFTIAFLGQKLFTRMRSANKHTGRIQQIFGIVIIATGLLIYTGYDKILQAKFLEVCGATGTWLTSFEQNEDITNRLQELRNPILGEQASQGGDLESKGPAPEFQGISTWLNTPNGQALSVKEDLKGKVVLIDFWTYSCINCIRTLPYVSGWHEKYKDSGFTVVGVHTPEFLFEHKTENVQAAIERYKITYPVAQDNNYSTWQAYNNQYWPAHYLLDTEGRVRYTHFGEGDYEETEAAIQALLEEAGQKKEESFLSVTAEEGASGIQTPETYLGKNRMERFRSTPKNPLLGENTFTLTAPLPLNSWGYKGAWNVEGERAIAQADARLEIQVRARKVFLVMGASAQPVLVEVWVDGKLISSELAGKDVQAGKILVSEERLYELVNGSQNGEHAIELHFPEGNVAVYAFTFS